MTRETRVKIFNLYLDINGLRRQGSKIESQEIQTIFKKIEKLKTNPMPKQMKKAQAKSWNEYRHVEKNIYQTGGKYRVRVGDFSEYTTTLKAARILRKQFRNMLEADPVLW